MPSVDVRSAPSASSKPAMSLPLWSKVAVARTMCCALSAEQSPSPLRKCCEDYGDDASSNRLFTSVPIEA